MRVAHHDKFVSRPSRAASVGGLLLFLPAAALIGAGIARGGQDVTSSTALVFIAFILVLCGTAVARARVSLELRECEVALGLWPLWRTRVPRSDLARAEVVTIDAFAEYGGWGIKGGSRQQRGRLYSVGGSRAVRLETANGRAFVVAFRDAATAEEACRAIVIRDPHRRAG